MEEIVKVEDADLASYEFSFSGTQKNLLDQMTPMEIILGESLLTPGLQTSIRFHNYIHVIPPRNLDEFKSSIFQLNINRPSLGRYGFPNKLDVEQVVYRCEQRKFINNNIQEFVLHICDQSLLSDAMSLVSKSWKCSTPSTVVRDVLTQCIGARNLDIESSRPARDYIAENIKPFQVITQQADVAYTGPDDPSFLHYMTYQNLGTHHFRSLYELCKQSPVVYYKFAEVGAAGGYGLPTSIITHQFPCDFDLLSDLLNGIDENGKDLTSLAIFNSVKRTFSLLGSQTLGCGIGAGVHKTVSSNETSAKDQNSCPDSYRVSRLKRQARMSLLDQNKIALRITVPWNPILNAGKIINIEMLNKEDSSGATKVYGSGDYLIASLKHNLLYGGYATTTLDCVSKTVGKGIV
jgi:hypothetical protein